MQAKPKPKATGVAVETVSRTELYEVMTAAASQDPALVQASSKRLKEMLEMFGTYDGLHEIAAQRAVPLPVRQQSIIQFKNAALNHWRTRKVLSDEQRVQIRDRCLTFLDEEDDMIAGCNNVITSRIARQDYPTTWPQLVNDLMRAIEENLHKRYNTGSTDPRDALILRRSLSVLNAILKEFYNYKMLTGLKTMSRLVDQLHAVLFGYYSRMSGRFSAATMTVQTISTPHMYTDLVLGHLVYKCIVKIGCWLWNRVEKMSHEEAVARETWLLELFQSSAVQAKSLIQLRADIMLALVGNGQLLDATSRQSIDILTRHIRLFGKFFRRLQQLAQPRFVSLPLCNELVLFYWGQVVTATSGPPEFIADSNDAVYPVRFLVQGMVLFKDNLAQWAPKKKNGSENLQSLSREFVETAVRVLITKFMPLNPQDLDNWMADPEEWVNLEDKENDQWEYEIRPCSERVLLQLSNQYTSYVTPLLESTFTQMATQPCADLASVVQKEALYCAIGRCAIRLKNVIPFTQWLEHTLVAEARDTNPIYPIIKRRIAWLIGKWVSETCTSPNNPRIWEVLIHLLTDQGPGTDAVVRLTAASAVRECVDTLEFEANVLEPFLPATVAELMKMIDEADTFESKRRLDNSLNTIIERMELRILPFVSIITEPLPKLWTSAEDNWLFKASLLVTVTRLVEAIKEHSANLTIIVVPLVRDSLQPNAMINLDEDALILWNSALRNVASVEVPSGAPSLLELFPRAIELLGTNMDLVSKINNVVESYLLLDAPRILQLCAVDLFRAYLSAFENGAMTLAIKDMLNTVSLVVQITPSTLWGEALHTSRLFAYVIMNLVEGESGSILSAEFIYFLARVVLVDRQMFLQLMSATAASKNVKETYLYEGLMDQWWGKFDSMSEPRQRKLTAMGVASLVSTGRPEVLQRLPTEIFNLWLDVFGEIKEAKIISENEKNLTGTESMKRYWEVDEMPDVYFQGSSGTAEYTRRRTIYDNDPVRVVMLSTYVGALLREAEAACGPQNFNANYLSKADPTVLKQLQAELV